MFKAAFPDTGVLEGYPIMAMRQAKDGKANDLLHQYYTQLGVNLQIVHPLDCPGALCCYHHGYWAAIDPKVRIAAVALGQAMQECIRIDEYRRPGDPETEHLPVFNWCHQAQVTRDQAQLAEQWFTDHREGIQVLMAEYEKRKNFLKSGLEEKILDSEKITALSDSKLQLARKASFSLLK